MLVDSDFPLLRRYSQAQLNRINLVLYSVFKGPVYGCLSRNGFQNLVRIKTLMASLEMFSAGNLYGGPGLLSARFDPLFSIEGMLSPSNLRPECFSYISDLIPEGSEAEPVLAYAKCYFAICHLNGSLVTFSWSDLRALLMDGGFSEDHVDSMLNAMKFWWVKTLKKSSRALNRHDFLIEDHVMSECAVAACLAVCFYRMVPLRLRLMDSQDCIRIMDSCMKLLWERCIPVWLSIGGPQMCMVKMLSMLSVIRASVVSNCASLPANTVPPSSLRNNVLGCFQTRCIGCNSGSSVGSENAGIHACGKEVICCTSSSSLVCDMIADISAGEDPLGTSRAAITKVLDTESLDCLNPLQRRMMKLLLSFGSSALRQQGSCRLSTLALHRLNVMEYRGLAHAMNFEVSMRDTGRACLGEMIYVSCGQRTLDWGMSGVNGKSTQLRRWSNCISMGCDGVKLDCDRLLRFVAFVKGCCVFSAQSDSVGCLLPRLEQCIRDCYSEPYTGDRVTCVAGLVSAFVCCVLMLGTNEFVILKDWLRKSIVVEDDEPSAKMPRLEPSYNPRARIHFPEFFVNGALVMPHETVG